MQIICFSVGKEKRQYFVSLPIFLSHTQWSRMLLFLNFYNTTNSEDRKVPAPILGDHKWKQHHQLLKDVKTLLLISFIKLPIKDSESKFKYVCSISVLPCGSAGKLSICNSGDVGSIHGLRRSPGEGKGYPLQYSGLENPMGSSICICVCLCVCVCMPN